MSVTVEKSAMRRMAVLMVMAAAAAALSGGAAPAQENCRPDALITERASDAAIRCALRSSRSAVEGRSISVVADDEEVPGVWFSINFNFDSATLTPGSRELVARIAKILTQDEELAGADLMVDGHTDAVGPDAYNLDLGARRAASVARALSRNGVEGELMRLRSFGETQLADPARPGAAVNRRVEITPFG